MTTFQELPRSTEHSYTQSGLERGSQRSIDGQMIAGIQSEAAVDGTQTPASQMVIDAQLQHAGGDQLAEAMSLTDTPVTAASATQRAAAMPQPHAHDTAVVAPLLPDAKAFADAHTALASGTNFGAPTSIGTHSVHVAESSSAGSQCCRDAQNSCAPGGFLRDPVLGVLADVVDDLEKVRIANANRVRQLTRTATDKDGEERGFGLTLDHPEVAKLALTVKALEAAEHDAILNLQRALRKHPLIGFQKRHKGIGEKQLARLLAVLGDPYWNDLHGRPRTVSELWAYAGFHVIKTSGSQPIGDAHCSAAAGTQTHAGSQAACDTQSRVAPGVAPKRTRGQKSNWSETARKRVWVIASAMPKFPGGKYEGVYRDAREKYADATHPVECVRCGPKNKPAPVGSPLSDGHKHARAVRIVAKEILKDLWLESRDLYASSSPADTAPGGEAARPAVSHNGAAAGRASDVPEQGTSRADTQYPHGSDCSTQNNLDSPR